MNGVLSSSAGLSMVVAALASVSLPVHAMVVQQNGGNACTGYTSVDDSALRKRSVGLVNESSSTVHVTCSLPTVSIYTPPNDSQHFKTVQVLISNPTSSYKTTSCTLVITIAQVDTVIYAGKVAVSPGFYSTLTFSPEGSRFSENTFAMTCALPPHAVIVRVKAETQEFQFIPME